MYLVSLHSGSENLVHITPDKFSYPIIQLLILIFVPFDPLGYRIHPLGQGLFCKLFLQTDCLSFLVWKFLKQVFLSRFICHSLCLWYLAVKDMKVKHILQRAGWKPPLCLLKRFLENFSSFESLFLAKAKRRWGLPSHAQLKITFFQPSQV